MLLLSSCQACRDFLALAQAHSKRWQKALQAERDQRVRLEETLEQLAKQHNHLERAFRGAAQANATADSKSKTGPRINTLTMCLLVFQQHVPLPAAPLLLLALIFVGCCISY